MSLEQLDISKFLPHRPPFLMVDKVLSIDDEHVSTSFKIKKDNILVENNLFSEVGLIECAAQTCSSIVGKGYFADDDTSGEGAKLIGFISAIKKVEVFDIPKVNTTIIINSKLVSRFDTNDYCICTLQCNIYEGEKELLSCQMNLFIQELKEGL